VRRAKGIETRNGPRRNKGGRGEGDEYTKGIKEIKKEG
jgi:hypothetical protein